MVGSRRQPSQQGGSEKITKATHSLLAFGVTEGSFCPQPGFSLELNLNGAAHSTISTKKPFGEFAVLGCPLVASLVCKHLRLESWGYLGSAADFSVFLQNEKGAASPLPLPRGSLLGGRGVEDQG